MGPEEEKVSVSAYSTFSPFQFSLQHLPLSGFSSVTWDHDTSVFVPPLHGFVSSVSYGEEVRRPLIQLAALVLLDGVAAVDVHGTIRIHRHHHLSDVGVDPPLLKPERRQNTQRGIKSGFQLGRKNAKKGLFLTNWLKWMSERTFISSTGRFILFNLTEYRRNQHKSDCICTPSLQNSYPMTDY